MSINIQHITKLYGEQKALDSVSFNIDEGEIVGFLGPNGAGKTTLLKILTGYIFPTEGDAWIDGYHIFHESLQVRKRIGYLPETNPLYSELYIWEYLRLVAGFYKITDNVTNIIKKTIEITGLGPEQHKKIGALSKGFRQRVGIAQALLHDPPVFILDEPTSGLDPNQIIEIRNLISEIGKRKTVLLSTHIMQEVEAICNRVVILHKGNIVADDKIENLHKLTKSNTQRIMVEFNKQIDESMLYNLPQIKNIIKQTDNVFILISEASKDIRSDIFDFAVANELTVLSLQKQEQGIDDVFQQLTNK